MADLIAVVFPTEEKAEEVRQKILDLQKDYLIDIGDAAIATKTDDGKVKLNQLLNTTAAGAAGGSFWGLLVGRPLPEPAARRRRRRGGGALAGRADRRGRERQVHEGARRRRPQARRGGALRAGASKVTGDKVLAELKGVGGRVLQTSLDHTREERAAQGAGRRPGGRGGSRLLTPAAGEADALARIEPGRLRPRGHGWRHRRHP